MIEEYQDEAEKELQSIIEKISGYQSKSPYRCGNCICYMRLSSKEKNVCAITAERKVVSELGWCPDFAHRYLVN